jgi:hypothetical protein
MNSTKQPDKRLLERANRQGRARRRGHLEQMVADLPERGESLRQIPDADLDAVRQELALESERRRERIERQLREPPKPQIQVRPVPLPEFED